MLIVKEKSFLLANFTLRKQRNDLFCEVCLSYLNAFDKNYFIIVLDENFLHGWIHFGFDTYTTLNLELILQVYMILFSLPNTEYSFDHHKEFRISYNVVVEFITFKKVGV